MIRGIPMGRLFGTDILVAPSFFLVMAVFFFIGNVAVVAIVWLCLVVSVLVHEFGHVFAVRKLLQAGSTVVLWGLGGLTLHEATSNRKKRIGIALMGPAFGLVLGLVFLGVRTLLPAADPEAPDPARIFVEVMVFVNFFWTAVNLLPIYPLDGGQALLAALEGRLDVDRARRAVARTSVFTAAAGLGVALYLDEPLLALFAGWLLIQNLGLGRSPGR